MNSCVLMAEIITEPQLRYTPEQKQVAEMQIEFAGMRTEDPPSKLKVVGWGNLAQEMHERHHQGDRVVVEGRLSMNTITLQDGTKQKVAELIAQRIHNLGNAASLGTMEPASTAAPAAPAPTSQSTNGSDRRTAEAKPKAKTPAAPAYAGAADAEDDIPFMRPVESKTVIGDDLIDLDIYRPRVGHEFRKF